MKRFYKEVSAEPVAGGWAIRLDGRPVKTPLRAPLQVAGAELAEAIADEWRVQGDSIDPRSMKLTGLANAAIDRVTADPEHFAVELGRYGETDLLCYRADEPPPLVARQQEVWDPLLAWASDRYDVHFQLVTGIMHRPQPAATVARLAEAIAARAPFALAALSPIVTISGSLVIGLALAEHAVEPDGAFDAAHLDEIWQAETWGEDYLALDARQARRADFLAAARFLELVESR